MWKQSSRNWNGDQPDTRVLRAHPWVTEGSGTIRYGIGVSARAPVATWDLWRQLVQAVEVLGFDSCWVQEKLNALPGPYPWNTPGTLAGTPRDIIAYYRPLIAAGIRYFMGHLARHDDLETIELLAQKVLPELQLG